MPKCLIFLVFHELRSSTSRRNRDDETKSKSTRIKLPAFTFTCGCTIDQKIMMPCFSRLNYELGLGEWRECRDNKCFPANDDHQNEPEIPTPLSQWSFLVSVLTSFIFFLFFFLCSALHLVVAACYI